MLICKILITLVEQDQPTAAQFLQRFVLNKTPWAHLDIAGMAFSKYGGALNSGGATGYGVRLLNKLIEDDYE
jgi:leucyl aminopeptidase